MNKSESMLGSKTVTSAHCGCRMIGHGMETADAFQHGVNELEDRVEERSTT